MKKILILACIVCLSATAMAVDAQAASSVAQTVKGKILLQVESKGEAWYIYPVNLKRYYLGRPLDAFNVMRNLGLGISEADYNKFNGTAPQSLSGRILLRVEANGEAYYVYPKTLEMHYLGKPGDAWIIMKFLGLGITNKDLNTIEKSTGGASESVDLSTVCPNDMLLYTNAYYGYQFCYNENGEIKENANHEITFSRLKGGESGQYDGLGYTLTNYSSISHFVSSLMGTTTLDFAGSNANKVEVAAYNQTADNNSKFYYVLAQDQTNKQILAFRYNQADENDTVFMDGIRQNFKFINPLANKVDPWYTATTMGDCPTDANQKFFKRDKGLHYYQFCYDKDWVITQDVGSLVKITPPILNGKQIKGELVATQYGGSLAANLAQMKTNSLYTNMKEYTAADGSPVLEFDYFQELGTKGTTAEAVTIHPYHYILIYNTKDTYEGARLDFNFSDSIAGYDFSDFRASVLNSLKFLKLNSVQ